MLRTTPCHGLLSIMLAAVFLILAAATVEAAEKELVVTAETAKIMRGMSLVKTVTRGTRFPLRQQKRGWYRIHFERNGELKPGWIHNEVVKAVEQQEVEVFVITAATAEIKRDTTVLAQVRLGQQFPLRETKGDWYGINFERSGKEEFGWIHKRNGKVSRIMQDQPVSSGRDDTTFDIHEFFRRDRVLSKVKANELQQQFYKAVGDDEYTKAATLALKIANALKENGHLHDPLTATWLERGGLCLHDGGSSPEAQTHIEQAIAIRRQAQGNEHPDTATSLEYLGLLLWRTGKHSEARPYYEEALTIRRDAQGVKPSLTAKTSSDLATLLYEAGDLPAARNHFAESLEIRTRVLGIDHPETGESLANLRLVLTRTNQPSTTDQ